MSGIMTLLELQCKSCGAKMQAERCHAGFSDMGFLYCSKDSTTLTWGAYDPYFDEVVGEKKMPWALTEEERRRVEDHLIGCPCGGRFLFANPPLCPTCGKAFGEPMLLTIYVLFLENGSTARSRRCGKNERVWARAQSLLIDFKSRPTGS